MFKVDKVQAASLRLLSKQIDWLLNNIHSTKYGVITLNIYKIFPLLLQSYPRKNVTIFKCWDSRVILPIIILLNVEKTYYCNI